MTEKKYGIVVGYDGSECGDLAVTWALEEARMRGTSLMVCHAWHYPYTGFFASVAAEFERAAEQVLQAAVERLRSEAPDVEIHRMLVCGSAAQHLIDFGPHAELVVVGTHGLSGVKKLMLGSVSSQVAMHCVSPVVVVRDRPDLPPENHPGQVVVGADGSPAADRALVLGFEEARLRGVPLTAVCAWTRPDKDAARALYVDQDGLRTLAGERFHEAVDRLRGRYPEVKAVAELSDEPVIEALQAAADSAQLLVLGSRGMGAVRGRLLGSVSQTMLHQAPCPVAVVHASEDHPADR